MYYFSNESEKLGIECDGCGKIYMFNKRYFSSISKTYCINNTLIQCPNCKNSIQPNTKIEAKEGTVSAKGDNNSIKCPKCGSTQIVAGNKGFGLGKAAAGAVLLGPVGLLGGVIGSQKVMVGCMKCGHRWQAGKK